jgi:putative resolvase
VRVNQRTVLVSPDATVESRPAAFGWYARVSSHDQKSDVDRQVAGLTGWAVAAGATVVVGVGRGRVGRGGSRAKVRRLLADPRVATVVVEHRDRLGPVNTERVESALLGTWPRLVVLDDDLVRDMVEVLTSLCAGLDGRPGARNRAPEAVGCAA